VIRWRSVGNNPLHRVQPSAVLVAPPFDRARVRAAVDDHFDFVWRTLRRLGSDRARADDLAQDVFLVFANKLSLIEPGLERRFLFRTAVHLSLHARRSERRSREVPDPDALERAPRAAPTAEEDLSQRELLALLDRLLDRLPDELREVIVLCDLEELSFTEAAELLHLPRGTVASRMRRARELLSAWAEEGSR
jgi:RNA polymerase sigma-70 factor (ECF subfamily)